MINRWFFFLFCTAHVVCIFFFIWHESRIIGLSYQQQRFEKEKHGLMLKRQQLMQEWLQLTHQADIKSFAAEHNMKKIGLQQMKVLP